MDEEQDKHEQAQPLKSFPTLDLDVDFLQLGTAERFEWFCFKLAQREFPELLAYAGPWDRGRDFGHYTHLHDFQAAETGRPSVTVREWTPRTATPFA